MSSEQGFRGIPGVPDGWELVAVRPGRCGDWHINADGKPVRVSRDTVNLLCIIRKIEVPKKYRPFANGLEYIKKRGNSIAVDWKSNDTYPGFFAVIAANAPFVWVSFGKNVELFDWQQALERLVFRYVDGSTSPFGVEITDENTAS